MNHGSLFSGIGGFDLAAEWMGWNNIFHCEWNPFGQQVLKHHFPNSISYHDITKTDFTIHRGSIDILTGGFPCQPYSTAGKRLGKADERHLFPEMLRAIKEIKPRWIVGENVRGLVNWNGGLVFNEVYDDLEREGYEVQSFLIPAAGVNAPHQRYRIWFVAYSNDKGRDARFGKNQSENGEISKRNNYAEFSDTSDEYATNSNGYGGQEYARSLGQKVFNIERERDKSSNWIDNNGKERIITNSNSRGLERSKEEGWDSEHAKRENGITTQENVANSKSIGQEYALEDRELEGRRFRKPNERNFWDSFPSKPPICGGDDGISREMDGITFSKWRNESIKAYGNAIVPQVAHQIFKAIEKFDELN